MTYDHLNTLLNLCQASPFASRDIHDIHHEEIYEQLDAVVGAQPLTKSSDPLVMRALEHAKIFGLYGDFRIQIDQNAPQWQTSLLDQAKAKGFSKKQARRLVGFFQQLRSTYNSLQSHYPGHWPSHTKLKNDLWVSIFGANLRRYINATSQIVHDMPIWITCEPGINTLPIYEILSKSLLHIYHEKEPLERSPTIHRTRLSPSDAQTQCSRLFGHGKNTLPYGPKTRDGIFKDTSPQDLIIIEDIQNATPETIDRLTWTINQKIYTPLGTDEHQTWTGRPVFISRKSIQELLGHEQLQLTQAQTLCGYTITMPALRTTFAQASESRRWWLDKLHHQLFGSSMSTEAISTVESTLDDVLGAGYSWPGNEHELLNTLKHIALTDQPPSPMTATSHPVTDELSSAMATGEISVRDLTIHYCKMLYERIGTYEGVASRTGLDRRTVKKYLAS